jgi:group I intron endonuclease
MQTFRYKEGKIYKIVNDVDGKIYIGSTCSKFNKRRNEHVSLAKKKPNRPVYAHFNTIGWETFKLVLIELYPCNSKMELEKRERYWIEQLKPELNVHLPTRNHIESCKNYRNNNKEKSKAYAAQYQIENKDRFEAMREINLEKRRDTHEWKRLREAHDRIDAQYSLL